MDYSKRKQLYPWVNSLTHARDRCNNPRNKNFKYYGGRGIKFLLTRKQIAYLWRRDGACFMSRPSLDRRNNNLNYTVRNSRFIEFNLNVVKDQKWYKLRQDLNQEISKVIGFPL